MNNNMQYFLLLFHCYYFLQSFILFHGATIILKCQYFELKKKTNDLTD